MIQHDETDEVIDAAAAARLLHLCEETVKRKARAGIIPGTKLGGSKWRFLRSSLMRLLTTPDNAKPQSAPAAKVQPVWSRSSTRPAKARAVLSRATVKSLLIFRAKRPLATRRATGRGQGAPETAEQQRHRAQTAPARAAQEEKRRQRYGQERSRDPGSAVDDFLRSRLERANVKKDTP